MTVFPLDQLPDIISKCDEYKDQSITFTPPSNVDLSSEQLTITSDISITFPSERFSCKKISISNCKVVIRNLTMCGSIKVDNGELEIFDSVIENPDPSIDFILAAQNNSTIIVNKCTFSDSTHFGVSGDNHSCLSFDQCLFKNIALYGIEVTFCSALKCTNTVFQDLDADSIIIADQCTAKIQKCEFTGRQKRAIFVRNAEYFVFDDSIVRNCKLSAFFISNCEQFLMSNCQIVDCEHTAIYLLEVLGVIKNTHIANCNGNGVNASHSRVLIKKCNFSHTTFPSIAICESAFGSILKCEIADSEMSGIIIRNDSQASIEKTNIRNAKLFGISISDSKEASIKNSLIIQCEEAAIAVYNNSHIKIKSTNLIGPCKYGFNVFTGGSVNSTDTTIIGMSNSAIWAHHAGYGLFQKLIVSTDQIPHDADIAQIVSNFDFTHVKENFDIEKIVKYESKRAFTIYNSFVVDYGFFEKNENLTALEPPTGINAIGAKCKICGGDTLNCSYTRCGHSIYCKRCWDALEVKPTKCELCLMPISDVVSPIELSHENEEGICSICFTDPPDSMVLPCGHTICDQCAKHWFLTSEVCPFCRQKNARSQLFVSYE